MAPLHYHEASPARSLRAFVGSYWTFRATAQFEAPYEHRVLPDGCASLVWSSAPGSPAHLFYTGPRLHAFSVPILPGALYWGVRLRPGAAGPLLHQSPATCGAPFHPLREVAPHLADTLARTLLPSLRDADVPPRLDAALAPFVEAAAPLDVPVAEAVARIEAAGGHVRVDALAEAVHLSPRQLQRRFRAATNLTPKQYARIRRFRSALHNVLRATPEAWGRVAVEHGFADQAHLVREFQALYGEAPGDFTRMIRLIDHGWVRP